MTDYNSITLKYRQQLVKALKHFEYSFKKIEKLSTQLSEDDEEAMETWESFSSRFSRVVDLFLTKYVRAIVLQNDPGFEGSLRDFVNQGEKLGVVSNPSNWMALRELRNISAHTYEDELSEFLTKLRDNSHNLLNLKAQLHAP